MHWLASATAFTRFHSLPPSEIKSLYGSITSSAVTSFSNFGGAIFFLYVDETVFCRRGECRRIPADEPLHTQRLAPCQLEHVVRHPVVASCAVEIGHGR